MGKCVQCEEFFSPNFMVDLEEKKDPPQKCAFCYLDRKEVTLVNDETKEEEVISKKEAAKRYRILLRKLKESKNIAKLLESHSMSYVNLDAKVSKDS